MEKIGFYGGSFNPPTNAHIQLAQKAIEQYKLDRLFFVPVGDKYSKNGLVEASKRVEMLNLAIKDYKKMQVLEIELNQEKNIKADEVFRMIQKQFDRTDNFFIMGADNFVNIEKWENAEDLIENFKYIILEREGFEVQDYIQQSNILSANSKNYNILKNVRVNMCSTMVRSQIESCKYLDLHGFLDSKVLEYIIDNKLYI